MDSAYLANASRLLSPAESIESNSLPRDSYVPVDPIFVGDVHQLEPTAVEYDPDDGAPWSWNL